MPRWTLCAASAVFGLKVQGGVRGVVENRWREEGRWDSSIVRGLEEGWLG